MSRVKQTVILDRRYVPKDNIIMKEGEPGNVAFLIQSGEVQVFTTAEEREVELARLGLGEIFGEMALIFDGPRTASVRASQDCNLIIISRVQFEEKLKDLDPTLRAVMQMLSRRIMQTNNTLIMKSQNIKDLQETVRLIYQNIQGELPEDQKKSFQDMVLPELENFMNAVKAFQEKHKA